MAVERRELVSLPVKLEKREDGSEKQVISGYAAVFYSESDAGTEYELWRGVRERIMPGCFDRCINEKQDVRALFNHDDNQLLGRCSASTLRLSVDQRGLRYEIDYDENDPDHQRVAAKMIRGDLTGSSFSFRPTREMWVDGEGEEDDIRELHDVDLYDVGPVTNPAYESTTSGIRAIGDLAEVRSKRDEAKRPAQEAERLRTSESDRMRLAIADVR